MGALRNRFLQSNYRDCYKCNSALGLRCVGCGRYVCEKHGNLHYNESSLCHDCTRAELAREDSIGLLHDYSREEEN